MKIREVFSERDNETLCALRIMGFIGVGFIGLAVVVASAPAEVGLGVAAIIGAVGGGIRLKGDGAA